MVTSAELDDFFSRCPKLYHMAMPGSWILIQKLGLLSTSSLLDVFNIPKDQKASLTGKRRPTSVPIHSDVFGNAVVRDQIPLSDADLETCLIDGLTPKRFHEILNERVFFWTNLQRLNTLMGARAYRDMEHDVLIVDTKCLVSDYYDNIEFTPMNSGCTRPWRHPRGPDTFLPIDKYRYAERQKKSKKDDVVVEVTVIGGVPDIAKYVVDARRMKNGQILRTL